MIENSRYRSPDSPPLGEACPLPANLNLSPLSIPAGTCTVIVFLTLTVPVPRQSEQVLAKVLPFPLQSGHVDLVTNEPKIVLCSTVTVPLP